MIVEAVVLILAAPVAATAVVARTPALAVILVIAEAAVTTMVKMADT